MYKYNKLSTLNWESGHDVVWMVWVQSITNIMLNYNIFQININFYL